MKKLFYVIAIAFAASLAFTSCSEEEVTPVVQSGGGSASTDPFKP
ncbi:MAG TPA: hypothetical protein PKC24_02740 [Cyclobacteriaceae bacterium]|nr:hypothetical protein [Cyclobacteriaceae bacterium]